MLLCKCFCCYRLCSRVFFYIVIVETFVIIDVLLCYKHVYVKLYFLGSSLYQKLERLFNYGERGKESGRDRQSTQRLLFTVISIKVTLPHECTLSSETPCIFFMFQILIQ